MNVAFLGLGGNTGNRLDNLNRALTELETRCGKILKTSSVYETESWGFVSDKKHLNQVVKLETKLNAQELLKEILEIEKKQGRKRKKNQSYGDRSLDIDLLFFNKERIHEKNLQVPHPRFHLRNFTLVPFHEIEPNFVHPVLKKSIRDLVKNSKDKLKVEKYKAQNTLKYICIEGNIGSGKSTLAKSLAKKWGADFLPEQFEQNQLLPLFYQNPKLYSFPVEYNFLINRFEHILAGLKNENVTLVSDFSIYKSLWFAKINLPKKEYQLFKKHFDAFVSLLPQPDLVVYLNTSINNLKKNILKRGRHYEQSIKNSYLQKLAKEYEKGLKQFPSQKIVTIDIANYALNTEKKVIKQIEKCRKEIFG